MQTQTRIQRAIGPRCIAVATWLAAISLSTSAIADVKTGSINNIMLNHADTCDGPVSAINLGDMSISVNNATSGAGRGLDAVFNVNPTSNMTNDPDLWSCFSLHWVQFITYDDDPAFVAGVAAGSPGLPFPVMDTPPNGWDYIYNDTNMNGSIQPAERNPGNVTSPSLVDDANDVLPWYHTTQEEAGAAGSGNTAPNWGLGQFDPGNIYGIKDVPGFPGTGTEHTDFSTFLVAVPNHNCPVNDGDCLRTNQMLVLAGFDWVWSRDNEVFSLSTPSQLADPAASINAALTNSGFPGGWQAVNDGTICCPEPGTWALLSMGLVGLVATRRRIRKAA